MKKLLVSMIVLLAAMGKAHAQSAPVEPAAPASQHKAGCTTDGPGTQDTATYIVNNSKVVYSAKSNQDPMDEVQITWDLQNGTLDTYTGDGNEFIMNFMSLDCERSLFGKDRPVDERRHFQ